MPKAFYVIRLLYFHGINCDWHNNRLTHFASCSNCSCTDRRVTFPKVFPIGLFNNFSNQEQTNAGEIKKLINEACQDLGIKKNNSKINFRVSQLLGSNACIVGTTSSPGGPLLCLGKTYFNNYESKTASQDPDYSEWLKILNELPDSPSELGKYIDACTSTKKSRIKELANKFIKFSHKTNYKVY